MRRQGQAPLFQTEEAQMFTRDSRSRYTIVTALTFGLSVLHAMPASAAGGLAICASGAGPQAPVPVPKDLEPNVASTFGLPVNVVRGGAFVRCAGAKLLACLVGANLNCGKVNARRSLPSARAFCRANPGADNIPMFATGHDTIYAWRCVGQRAVATKTVVAADPYGYDAGHWKEVYR
jgi:hypothetical protein